MSGIAGIINFDGAPIDPNLIERMTTPMAYRGPDGIHHWVKGSIALGQCMLRTTPESLEEHQPLTNEDESLVLVMDGRVDNWKELRVELLGRGAVLRDRSNAELVLRAYEIWGEDCPDRIIGEFVFFVWDARQQQLFGARDAAGTRHFYYHEGNGWFGFSSEIKSLLATERIEPRLNESRLLDYLVVEFDRDDEVGTFYQDIDRMPAGHAMRITERDVKTWRYWNPVNLPVTSFSSLDECAEALLVQLRIAVQCRLRSNGPVGAMLSGGLDSSSIVGLISKKFRNDLNQPLKTFSLIRKDRENCLDWHSIREMLKDDWIDPTIITADIAADICRTSLDGIMHYDEPFDFTNGFTDSIVYKSASANGCRVILDGMAGDCLFYSLPSSLDCIYRRKMFSQIPSILAAYHRHGQGIQNCLKSLSWKTLRVATPEKIRVLYRKIRDCWEIEKYKVNKTPGNLLNLLHKNIAKEFLETRRSHREQAINHVETGNDLRTHARRFTTGVLSFAHEVNGQIALSNGVEPRSPFSDRRLIEFAIQMPLEAKLSVPWYKYVLRKSMKDILPEEVRWRSDLGGHPGWKFFEQFIKEMARIAPEIWSHSCLNNSLNRWIDVSNLGFAWGEYDRSGDYSTGYNIFILAVLSQWLSTHKRVVHCLNSS